MQSAAPAQDPRHPTPTRALTVALAVLVGALGCPVFTSIEPCANDAECAAPMRCGADGFCGTTGDEDGGAPAGDAGGPRDDAGAPADDDGGLVVDGGAPQDAGAPDAGRTDAGQVVLDAGFPDGGNGPQLRITVSAQEALPAGYAIAADVDTSALGDAGTLSLVAVPGGAPVDFVVDPNASLAAPPTRVWFAIPSALATSASATFLLTKRAGGPGPSPELDAVFKVGDTFDDGALSETLSPSLGAQGTVDQGDGGIRIRIPDPDDAAILRSVVPVSRATPFEIRIQARAINVGPSGGAGVGFMRMLSLIEGFVPAAAQDIDALVAHHVYSWFMAEGGMIFTYIEIGNLSDDSAAHYWLNDDQWHASPLADVRYSGERNDTMELTFVSDGTEFWFTLTDAADGVVADSAGDPVPWADIDVRVDGGSVGADPPLYFFVGDPFYGGYPAFSGDVRVEFVLARDMVVDEPSVVVELE